MISTIELYSRRTIIRSSTSEHFDSSTHAVQHGLYTSPKLSRRGGGTFATDVASGIQKHTGSYMIHNALEGLVIGVAKWDADGIGTVLVVEAAHSLLKEAVIGSNLVELATLAGVESSATIATLLALDTVAA